MTSFAKQHRFSTVTENLPSVWNYDTVKLDCNSRIKTAQSVSIGKSKRSSLEMNPKIPGPGSYDLNATTRFKAPNPVLIGKPKASKQNGVPGPGSYSPDTSILLLTNPKFSMTGNHFHQKEDKKPSPWDYSPNLKSIAKTDPAIGFAQQKRETKDDRLYYPGPGNYNPEIKDDNCLKFSFGAEEKFHTQELIIKQKNKVPGPGQYRIHIDKKVRGYKFLGSKRQTFNDVCLPGPGDYSLDKYNGKRSAGCIIGKSPRLKNDDQEIPGPKYQVTPVQLYKMRKTAVSFSKSKKERGYQTFVPGPGAYQTEKSLIEKNAVTLKGHVAKEKIHQGPGPVDYNPNYNSVLNKSPCARISDTKSQRNDKQMIPGPCSYKTEDDYKVKSFYFPKQDKNTARKEITPGPGHYSLKPQFGNVTLTSKSFKALA